MEQIITGFRTIKDVEKTLEALEKQGYIWATKYKASPDLSWINFFKEYQENWWFYINYKNEFWFWNINSSWRLSEKINFNLIIIE